MNKSGVKGFSSLFNVLTYLSSDWQIDGIVRLDLLNVVKIRKVPIIVRFPFDGSVLGRFRGSVGQPCIGGRRS